MKCQYFSKGHCDSQGKKFKAKKVIIATKRQLKQAYMKAQGLRNKCERKSMNLRDPCFWLEQPN